jgi:hypothetical protein
MMNLQCDGCYKSITLEENKVPKSVTVFDVVTDRRIIACFHLCFKCATERSYFNINNPFYRAPSEDAESEKKAAQGG